MRKIIPFILIILILAVSGASYLLYKELMLAKEDAQSPLQEEKDVLFEKIEKLILLPKGEEPSLMTVVDPLELKNTVFFDKVKAGDKILIYNQAKKVIIYDPLAEKIVDAFPFNPKTKKEEPAPEPEPETATSTEEGNLEEEN